MFVCEELEYSLVFSMDNFVILLCTFLHFVILLNDELYLNDSFE